MKLQQLLYENTFFAPSFKHMLDLGHETARFLSENCDPWLRESKGAIAYRGISKHHTDADVLAYIKRVRSDRKPKDTPENVHNVFNKIIATCGKVANRTNAAFVTGDKWQAGEYGSVYAVFPIGNFNYTWMENVSDWTNLQNQLVMSASLTDSDLQEIRKKFGEQHDDTMKEMTNILQHVVSISKKYGLETTIEDLAETLNKWSWSGYVSNDVFDALDQTGKAFPTTVSLFTRLYEVYTKATPSEKRILREGLQKVNSLFYGGRFSTSKEGFVQTKILSYEMSFAQGRKDLDVKEEAIRKNLCPTLKGDDGTLARAIKEGLEIMIKCDSLCIVDKSFFTVFVNPLLQNKTVNKSNIHIINRPDMKVNPTVQLKKAI